MNWDDGVPITAPKISLFGYMRAVLRGGALLLLILVCLSLKALVRLIEAPLFKGRRPLSPLFTQIVCRGFFPILGMGHEVRGHPFQGQGAAVANHASWIDIFALNARSRIFFVSKAEVRGWPGIGILARITGTVFINRKRTDAAKHAAMIGERLAMGHRLMFFPEGTSTDSRRVLPFRTTLFQPFVEMAKTQDLMIQPISLEYVAPKGQDPRFYGWWGDMDFGPSLLQALAFSKHGKVILTYHPPVRIVDFNDRKTLASHLRDQVASSLPFN